MEVQRIRDGLWRWTAPHPDWVAGGTGAAAWPQAVGSVYYEAPDATVLIDPLVPPEGTVDEARFWAALDRDVGRRGLPVATLRTIHWHERSIASIRARYAVLIGSPAGVERFPLGDPHGEEEFLITEHRALVVGDILLGSDVAGGAAGALTTCPASWYDGDDVERAWYRDSSRSALLPLLDRPIERVLVSHGTPVLTGGREALRVALGAAVS